jgi:RNA polymerase sigma factor (sigma-70 family)
MPTRKWIVRPPQTDPDAELVRGMAAGHERALATLYERHAGPVLGYLARRVRDRELAEELLHDVMLASWESAAAYRGEASVRTWLFAIAHNRALNALRGRPGPGTIVELSDASATADASERAEGAAEGIDLATAMERLPQQQQVALELVFVHGFTAAEVASVMSVAPGTVRSWLSRARAALRDGLSPSGGNDV